MMMTNLAVVVCLGLCVLLNWVAITQQTLSETELHESYSREIYCGVADFTGSIWIGQKAAEVVAYSKEAFDSMTGGRWSDEDLAADWQGIYCL